ncbi:MAG: Fe3+-hydroxamate transporter permease FhuB [Xanthobacteraceae bacterium]|nr:Fe3+-hydroxamate transporter permease FhuB [Xanthobacteraceae bacterium]
MIVADWLGRNLLLPYQIPAGLLTILVGAPYFIRLMSRQ